MEHNEFKDQLYEVLDENDVALGIEDIDTSDAANIFTIKTRDGSVFEIETRNKRQHDASKQEVCNCGEKLHYRHRTGTVQKGCRSLCRTV